MIQFARVLAAGGLFWLGASLAWAQAPATPPATPQESAAPSAQPPAAAAPLETPAAKPQPPRRAGPRVTAATPECAWTGRRIVALLIRDDPDTADKFRRFYESFGCPAEHIGPAMRCVVISDGAAEGQAKALAERVEACWDKPSVRFLNR